MSFESPPQERQHLAEGVAHGGGRSGKAVAHTGVDLHFDCAARTDDGISETVRLAHGHDRVSSAVQDEERRETPGLPSE